MIVKAEQYNKKHNYWKNGMCLEYENGVESIIISDDDKSIIDVKLKGSSHQNREFLGIIKHLFREVHGTSFSPSEMVPLTKDIHDGQFYPYQDLLSLEQDSLKENAFGSPPKKYTVSELLNGYRLDIDIGKKEYTKNEIHHHYGNEFHGNIKINNYYSEVKNAFEEFKTIPSSSQQEKELIEDIENSIGTLDKAPDKKSAIKYIKDKIEKFDGIRKQVDGYTEKYDKAATTIGNLINKLDGFWDIVDKI